MNRPVITLALALVSMPALATQLPFAPLEYKGSRTQVEYEAEFGGEIRYADDKGVVAFGTVGYKRGIVRSVSGRGQLRIREDVRNFKDVSRQCHEEFFLLPNAQAWSKRGKERFARDFTASASERDVDLLLRNAFGVVPQGFVSTTTEDLSITHGLQVARTTMTVHAIRLDFESQYGFTSCSVSKARPVRVRHTWWLSDEVPGGLAGRRDVIVFEHAGGEYETEYRQTIEMIGTEKELLADAEKGREAEQIRELLEENLGRLARLEQEAPEDYRQVLPITLSEIEEALAGARKDHPALYASLKEKYPAPVRDYERGGKAEERRTRKPDRFKKVKTVEESEGPGLFDDVSAAGDE